MLSGGRGRGRGRYQRAAMSDINITPFVDVMLVLLVVFMITAPLLTQGVQVSLPEVENAPITDTEEPVQVTIKQNGVVFIQTQKVEGKELATRLLAIRKVRPNVAILLRADRNVSYGNVMNVMSALQNAGLVDVGLVTQAVGAE